MSNYGFTIVRNCQIDQKIEFLKEKRFRSRHGINYLFGYNSFDKFQKDKCFKENESFIIGLDGVILNLTLLKNEYAISDFFLLMIQIYEKRKEKVAIELKGNFSGFVFDKKKEELIYFNDKVASKQVFYAFVGDMFILSPEIKNIVSLKQQKNIESSLNISASYNMLTYGGMLGDQTLIENISKLNAGSFLTINGDNVLLNKYYDFNNIEYVLSNKKKTIDQLDDRFKSAVLLEYNKDIEYNYRSLATLSGGIDSRLNVMMANEMGFKVDSFCFSQSDYLDEKIARNISEDLDLNFQFIALDDGDYLRDLAENIEINNGLQFYLSAAHFNNALKQVDLQSHGLIHTGLAGDGVLGGFLGKNSTPDFYSNRISNKFIDKAESEIHKDYKNEEVFKLYQRVFNITNFGSYVVESQKSYLVSPFLDEDFLTTALSIDPILKKDQIYLDWLQKKHLNVTKYKWERTGFKPNAKYKTKLSRYTNKIKKEFLIIANQEYKLSMTPEDFWLKNNLKNKEFYSSIFNAKVELVSSNEELFTDLYLAFESGNINEKAAVLTILEMIDKFKLVI